jgi:hypothetical protein
MTIQAGVPNYLKQNYSTQNSRQALSLNRSSNQFSNGAGKTGARISVAPQTATTNGSMTISKSIQSRTQGKSVLRVALELELAAR